MFNQIEHKTYSCGNSSGLDINKIAPDSLLIYP